MNQAAEMEANRGKQEPSIELGSGDRDRDYGGGNFDFRVAEGRQVNEVLDSSIRPAAAPVAVNSVAPVTESEYSPKAKKNRSPKAPKPLTAREIASEKVVDMTAFKTAGDYSPPAVFDADKWKRSRVKKGYLIARISGYDVVEGEYGVHYLKVIHRDPKTGKKKTSGDYSLYEHAGFSTWQTMQKTGKLVKEKKRNERINENRADAS
jgi:hypothetical protein